MEKQESSGNGEEIKLKKKPSEKEHYVNNREFSQAVVEYVTSVTKAKSENVEVPQISEYIGQCLLNIANGLSRKPNFFRYTYRDDMILDAVENCIKAVGNFRIEAKTRSGLPNAFAYFTQISYFAFLRRIQKEQRYHETKVSYMESAGISAFASFSEEGPDGEGIINKIRTKSDRFYGEKEETPSDEIYKTNRFKKLNVIAPASKKQPEKETQLSEFIEAA